MPRSKPAAKSGKKTRSKPAPSIVMAPAQIVRRPKAPKQRAEKPATPQAAKQEGIATTQDERYALPGYCRDNPDYLAGDVLRQFANERGMSRSEVDSMTDDKVREQLRYLVSRQYEEA